MPDRDLALVDRLERLHPAVVSDCLDAIGLRHQVLAPHVRPLWREARLAGIALTVQADAADGVPQAREDRYRDQIAAVDALTEGDVMVVSRCDAAFWGELLATAARARGARGIVVDGWARDTGALEAMSFPTFVSGVHCADALGRVEVAAHGVEIECAGVVVRTGDLVLGDRDGVVVVPADVAPQIVATAEEKVAAESVVRERLAEGMPVAEAFRRYGIL